MNSIVAIVVTYNRCGLLLECLEALQRSSVTTDIYIIDNASTDGTAKATAPYVDGRSVFYFNTGANLGGAGGYNYGIRKACEAGYELLWLMDDDTIVHEDTLSELLKAREKVGNSGFVSSTALWTDGSICRMNHHSAATRFSDWNEDKLLAREGIVRIEDATFVSFLVSRTVVEEVGLPIREYFIWGDDYEYSMRIAARYPCYLAARSVVTHKMSDNISTGSIVDIDDVRRIKRTAISFRNDCCTFRRMGKKDFLKFTWSTFRRAAEVLSRGNAHRWLKLKSVLGGYLRGLAFHPKIEYLDGKERSRV